jgi:hypothetical protein
MIFTVPNSNGEPEVDLRELNRCHGPGRGHPCTTRGLAGKRGDALSYDLRRAKALGIDVSVTKNPIPGYYKQSYSVPFLSGPPGRKPYVEVFSDTTPSTAHRSVDVSTTRHEVGHVTDRAYGSKDEKKGHLQDRSAATIFGVRYSPMYVSEIGAWKAAIRDAPYNRVNWTVVQKALTGYLEHEPAMRGLFGARGMVTFAPAVASRHIGLLKRYAKRLRKKSLTPKAVLDPVPPKDWQRAVD